MAEKADKSVALMVEGLSRAATAPQGVPLFGQRKTPGLFARTAAAQTAARRCLDTGYLQVVGVETKGKSAFDLCTITEKGVSFLLRQTSPQSVLESLSHAITAQGAASPQLVAEVQSCQETYATLEQQLGHLVTHLHQPAATNGAVPHLNGNGKPQANVDWRGFVVPFLREWESKRPHQDCPLPELYRHLCHHAPDLTIGQFHDGLRQMFAAGQVRLYPWTGPLHELPEPALALLVGHAVAFYVGPNSSV